MRVKNLLLIVLLLFSFSCARGKKETGPRPFAVSFIRPEVRDLSNFTYFTGTIRAEEEVKVYPRVEGKIYQKLTHKGEEVEKGQVLFTIDRDIVGYRFEKARVESPISGRVSMVYISTGDQVGPQVPLALVQKDALVKMQIWAGAKDYFRIQPGQAAYLEVGAYSGRQFEGKVSEVSPFFDSSTHTALIEVKVDNRKGELKPGMFAEVKIEVDSKLQALTILFDAVLEDEQGSYVYLVEEGRAVKRYIEKGLRSQEYLEIISGLEKEKKIAYKGKEFLEEGMKVKVK